MAIRRPLKAIRAKCLECSNDQAAEVRLCPCTDCALWEYRMGHRPKDEGIIEEEAENAKNLTAVEVFDKIEEVEEDGVRGQTT